MVPVRQYMWGVHDMFVDSGHNMKQDIKCYFDENFVWERTCDIKPSQTEDDQSTENIKWVLCALQQQTMNRGTRYGEGRLRMLSIHKSTVKDGGCGAFSEKTYYKGNMITLYVGNGVTTQNSDTHDEYTYRMEVSKLRSVDVTYPRKFLLGAHLMNDRNHESEDIEQDTYEDENEQPNCKKWVVLLTIIVNLKALSFKQHVKS